MAYSDTTWVGISAREKRSASYQTEVFRLQRTSQAQQRPLDADNHVNETRLMKWSGGPNSATCRSFNALGMCFVQNGWPNEGRRDKGNKRKVRIHTMLRS